MQIEGYSGGLSRLRADVLFVSCFEDIRPIQGLASEVDWIYSGVFSKMLMQNHFSGGLGEALLIPTDEKLHVPKVILLGLGKSTAYGESEFQKMVSVLFKTISGLNVGDCAIGVETITALLSPIEPQALASSLLEAWRSKGYIGSVQMTFVFNDQARARVFQHKMTDGCVKKETQSQYISE